MGTLWERTGVPCKAGIQAETFGQDVLLSPSGLMATITSIDVRRAMTTGRTYRFVIRQIRSKVLVLSAAGVPVNYFHGETVLQGTA